jgi:hypothetical protein
MEKDLQRQMNDIKARRPKKKKNFKNDLYEFLDPAHFSILKNQQQLFANSKKSKLTIKTNF